MIKKILIALSAAILISSVALIPSASAEEASPNYEKKAVEAYAAVGSSDIVEFTCLFRSNLPEVPFVNAEDYLGQLFAFDKEVSNNGSGIYTFENDGYTMTLDAEKDLIFFDFYEGFLSGNQKNESDFGSFPYIESKNTLGFSGSGMEFTDEINSFELDLAKYDLDIVDEDGSVYLPLCTLNDIFLDTSYAMTYKKDKLKMVYADQMGAKGSFSDRRSKEYAKFIYDEFCYATDYFYGKPSNALISDEIGKNGLDKALDSYNSITPRIKELLLSESTEDFCAGWVLLQYYFDDGGHTILDYSIKELLKKYDITDSASAARKIFGDTGNEDAAAIIASAQNASEIQDISGKLTTGKINAYNGFETIKEWQGAKLCKSGDTYFFDFRDFSMNAIEPFKWSLDYAAENGAKNFVVDTNGGGYSDVAIYMFSLMCDNVKYKEKMLGSDNIMIFNGRVDKNLDGKFDEKDDEVKYDFRFAVLANRGHYSCANIMACMAQDNGICVIGERTAGGSCAATVRMLPNGTAYNVSGYSMYIREDGKDADEGVEPDVPVELSGDDFSGLYDVNMINKGIAGFYGDPIPQQVGTYGDLDGDSTVTSADALYVLRISVGLESETSENKKLADVDSDGEVNSADALNILRFSVGMSDADTKINTPV